MSSAACACSTLADAARRSAFCTSASCTSASSAGSRKVCNRSPGISPAPRPGACHAAGGLPGGPSASSVSVAWSGGSRSAQADSASMPATSTMRDDFRLSDRMGLVQLQDQVVGVGAHADDHLADDVDRAEVLGVDRALADRARGEEEFFVGVVDAELHGEAAGRQLHRRVRKEAAHRQLALAVRPYDGIDLRLAYAARL